LRDANTANDAVKPTAILTKNKDYENKIQDEEDPKEI